MTESSLAPRMPSELGNAALALARVGLAIFPCWPRGKTPLTTNGHLDATCDEAAIRAWWRRWPNANIGVRTGAQSGLTVVDLDGDEGERLLALLVERFGTLPPTSESTTGKGRHLWYALPEGSGPVPSSTGKGLDIRGDGGYVIAPPSVHPTGRRYCWSVDSASAFAAAPTWLLDKITTPANGTMPAVPLSDWRALVRDGVGEGARDCTIAKLAGYLLRRRIRTRQQRSRRPVVCDPRERKERRHTGISRALSSTITR